jgi:hypothetical protein
MLPVFILQNVQTKLGAYPVPYLVGSSSGKVAGELRWPFVSIQRQRSEWVEL